MIDHISIRVKDLKKSAAFYEAALRAIGIKIGRVRRSDHINFSLELRV